MQVLYPLSSSGIVFAAYAQCMQPSPYLHATLASYADLRQDSGTKMCESVGSNYVNITYDCYEHVLHDWKECEIVGSWAH